MRVTPKPDPILTPFPLSPLSKSLDTEILMLQNNENEIKTIVTQSQKHTGQNSVVNLKDQSSEFRKGSNMSSVRMPEDDTFEDAYDDSSAIVDAKSKPLHMSKDEPSIPNFEEEKVLPREFRRTNAIQPRQPSNNNNIVDHLASNLDHLPQRQIKHADVSTNTMILSQEIDELQTRVENQEKVKFNLKSVSTNTQNQPTPRAPQNEKKPNNDMFNDIIQELEKDSVFYKNITHLIGEKLAEKSSEIFKENFKSKEGETEILRNVITRYLQSCKSEIIHDAKDDLPSLMEKSSKKANIGHFVTQDNQPISSLIPDKNIAKSRTKKLKYKSSS